jgi:hypothetical protein
MLVAAVAAAALAGFVTASWPLAALPKLAVGALLMAIAYPAALLVVGQGRLLTGFFHSLAASEPAA